MLAGGGLIVGVNSCSKRPEPNLDKRIEKKIEQRPEQQKGSNYNTNFILVHGYETREIGYDV